MKPKTIKANIARFEAELATVDRPGMDKLLDYIQKSDFYKAPASTKFHMACEGGLLQHSLNVLDALRGILPARLSKDNVRDYMLAGESIATIPEESVIITGLLHDICKTYFYTTSWRNAKNEETGKWEKVPFYTVQDRMPLGHGAKSAMLLKEYIKLTNPEMYAIWWHMGFADLTGIDQATFRAAVEMQPLVWALHTADMMASAFMEGETENKAPYNDVPEPAPEAAPSPDDADAPPDGEPVFQDAPPLH